MKKLPKEKVALYAYVSPECKEKLACLTKLYEMAGRKFSLGDVIEENINLLYTTAYLSQESDLWPGLIKLTNILDPSEAQNQGVNDVIKIIKAKRKEAGEVLTVPVSPRKNFVKVVKRDLQKLFHFEKDDDSEA